MDYIDLILFILGFAGYSVPYKKGVKMTAGNEIVLFSSGDVNVEVLVSPEQDTVWLTQKQMGALFDVKQATISEHINNILDVNELDETSIGISDRSTGGRKPRVYNLDMILSVGYRVNSKRGIEFRRWANSVLKQYIIRVFHNSCCSFEGMWTDGQQKEIPDSGRNNTETYSHDQHGV